MTTVTCTEIKNRFGQYLESALKEPVFIEKTGRAVAVLLSMEDFENMQAHEDKLWADKAKKAAKKGFVGHEESMKFLLSK